MSKNIIITYDIDPLWNIVSRIRENVRQFLDVYDDEIKDAGAMVASELVENAVKYSNIQNNASNINFQMLADDCQIQISLVNPIRSKSDFTALKANIDRINSSKKPKELYMNQLVYLMRNSSTDRTRLGLYRIAYEGAFGLRCILENNMVTVTAVRNI